MSFRLIALSTVLAAFSVLTGLALMQVGYLGIIQMHLRNWGGAQVFTDLVIVAVFTCRWIVRDARAHGMAAWPFVAVTVFAGSFGPLLYVLVREFREAGERRLGEMQAA